MAARALPDLVARLKLDNSDLQLAAQAVTQMARHVEAAANTSTSGLRRIQSEAGNTHSAVTRLGTSFAGMAAGVVGGMAAYAGFAGIMGTVAGAVRSTIGAGIAFGDQMNTLRAVTGATAAQMAQLQQKSIDLGNDLTLPNTSASDAAAAMTELAKAGLSVGDSMAAAKGTLQLAAAAGVDEATAATLAATALNSFHLQGKEAVRVADLLAASANASAADIGQVGLAMQQSAAIFSAAKIPIDDLVAAIGEMANSGIAGSDAGTSLKEVLLKLQGPSGQASDAMKAIGLSIYDAHGNMVPFRDIIVRAHDALAKLTPQQRDQATATIFGSDAARAANIIFGQGVGVFDAMHAAVTKVGAAQDVASAKSKGLGGAIRAVQSEMETMSLQIYQRLEPGMEALTKRAGEALPRAFDAASGLLSGKRSVGQTAMAGLEAVGMSPEAAGKIAGPITDISASVGRLAAAFDSLARSASPMLKDLGDLLLRAVPPALDLANDVAQFLAPAIKATADHMDTLRPVFTALVVGWSIWQTVILATNIVLWAQTAGIYAYVAATYVVRAAMTAWTIVADACALAQDLNTFALQRGYIGTIIYVAGLVAARVANVAGAVATGVATAAQWAYNAAMSANPIGLVILGIAALIAIIVLVVTHWDQVSAALGAAWGWILQVVQAHAWLQAALTVLLGPIVLVVSHWNQVIGVLSAVINWFAHTGDALSALGGVANAVAGAIGGAFSGIGGAIHSGLSAVVGVIDRFDQMVDNIPVIGGILNLPRLPAFAEGGIVNRPTVGVFGEAGPEALIPLGGGPGALALWRQAGEMLGVHGLGASTTPGDWAGQCVVAVESWTNHHFPVAMASQMSQFVNASRPAPGEIFVSTLPPFGHTGIVIGGGKVIDSNWGLDERVRIHNLSDVPRIAGYIAGIPAAGLPGGVFDATAAMKGLVNRALGGLGGWQGSVAGGLIGQIIAGVASRFDEGGIWPSGTVGVNTSGRDEYVLTEDQLSRVGSRMSTSRMERLLAQQNHLLERIAASSSAPIFSNRAYGA
jgi:TP901 family phage tail tape measure protein